MSSIAKKEANVKNAKKSTGPKSIEGKSRSSQNAVKHGAYATKHLLDGEDKILYEAIKVEQRNAFRPKSFIETALVDELINQLWTLRRLERAERYYLTQSQAEVTEGGDSTVFHELAKRISPPKEDAAQADKSTSEKQREFYERVYIYDAGGRIERLSSQKRLALQTILSIERELERRLKKATK
jgi:hypothetical protein